MLRIKILEGLALLTKDEILLKKIYNTLYKLKSRQAQILIKQAQKLIEESKQHKKDAREMIKIKI